MPFNVDALLGLPAQSLKIRAHRAELLANNLANADTPQFKARDIDFQAALAAAEQTQQGALKLRATHSAHHKFNENPSNFEILYRQPTQDSIDGNTVDADREKSAYTENAIRYRASLTLINGRIRSMMSALRGE